MADECGCNNTECGRCFPWANDEREMRVKERVADVVAIMRDFRMRRLRLMSERHAVLPDEELPPDLKREAEALAILRELNLA